MTAINRKEYKLKRLCETLIEQTLGDLSKFPSELRQCVIEVYREFMIGYLNMLRQKEKKPADWVPATVSIDSELTLQMRHFFSDYQHLTAKFYKLNLEMKRLLALDRENQRTLYQHTVDRILKRCGWQVKPGERHEKYG